MKKILFIFILLYPFFIFPTTSSNVYVTANNLYLSLFTVLMLSLLVWQIIFKKKNIKIKISTPIMLIIIFLFIILISTLISVDPTHSIYGEYWRYEGFIAWMCYVSLFFFTFFYADIDEENIKKFLAMLTISAVILSLYGILQHFSLDFLPRPLHRIGETRSYSLFGNPNFFGAYLVLMIFISIAIYFVNKTKGKVILSYLSVQIIYLALLYSLTRSAWLGMFLGFVFLFIFVLWKRRDLLIKIVILAVGFMFIFSIVQLTEEHSYLDRGNSIVKDATEIFEGNDGRAGASRWYIWKTAFPLVEEYFWVGSGPDTFALVFPHNKEELDKYFNDPNIKIDKAHNEYLQIAITLGVPALIVYLLILSCIFIPAVKRVIILNEDKQTFLVCLVIAGIAYMIQAFFNISVITVAPYFWILLGFLGWYTQNEKI